MRRSVLPAGDDNLIMGKLRRAFLLVLFYACRFYRLDCHNRTGSVQSNGAVRITL